MLIRNIAAVVVWAVDMRILVRIAHSHVDQRKIEFILQLTNQTNRLRQIRLHAPFMNAEAIRISKTVVYIQPAGQEKAARNTRLRCSKSIFQKACPILIAPAIRTRARIRAEQLTRQIAMTAFYIHAVKARLLAESSSRLKRILIPSQLIIGQHAKRLFKPFLQRRAAICNQRLRSAQRLGIASAVCRLHNQKRRIPIFLQADFTYSLRQTFEFIDVFLRQIKLMCACPTLPNGRHGFKPDYAGSCLRKTLIAAYRQFIRRTVLRSIRALHGLKCNPVLRRLSRERQRLIQNG